MRIDATSNSSKMGGETSARGDCGVEDGVCSPRALPISKDSNSSDGDGDGAVQLLTKSSAGHKTVYVKACEMVGDLLRANTHKVRKDHVAVRRAIVLARDKFGIELFLGQRRLIVICRSLHHARWQKAGRRSTQKLRTIHVLT
jgi:hypothetical protein